MIDGQAEALKDLREAATDHRANSYPQVITNWKWLNNNLGISKEAILQFF